LAIPSRPLPAFLNPEVPAAAPAVVSAAPHAAPVAGGVKVNKARPFSAEDLEASYQRQLAAQQQRLNAKWPNWLDRILNPPNPAQPGAGLLPTLPPGQGFPLINSLLNS
jgi:hypothetical protein